ncbi:CBP80/20-dependent translation initiation factor isoform X2 [Coregonus clupeaformis]|uniref:CBP80/20-dependent translation initiation factor isoform X2 n=1 Tax=Coregonus clupeaformis TaxID=59861 RepID=UPI001BE00E19|nr:CBP80/20-dependent translation initiation factor isoform X2 [Coregonus clupeaformis]
MENSSVASASSEAGSTRSQEIEELERFIDSYVLEYQVQGLLGDKSETDLDGDNKPQSHISQWTEDCNDKKDGSWSPSWGRGSTKPDEWDHSSNGSTGSRPSSGSRPGSGSRSGSRGRNNQFRGPAKVQNGNREGSFDILGTDIWAANTMDSHGGATWDLQPEKLDFSQFHRKPFRGTPKHLPHIDREGSESPYIPPIDPLPWDKHENDDAGPFHYYLELMMKGKFEYDDGINLNDMEKFLPGLTGFPPLPNEAEIAHTKKLFRRRRNDRRGVHHIIQDHLGLTVLLPPRGKRQVSVRRQQQQRPPGGGGGDRKTQNLQQQQSPQQKPPSNQQQQPVNQQQNDQQQPGPGGNARHPRDQQQQGGQCGGSHGQQFQGHDGQHQGPPHHGYSQNRRWHHNQQGQGGGQGLRVQGGPAGDRDRGATPTGDGDKGAPPRKTKETENVKAAEAITRLEPESSRGPNEGPPSQPGGQGGPKVSLLPSSKERLRRRLKDKEEAIVSPVGPQRSRMDRLLEILNSMRNNSAGVDGQLSSFMEEAQTSAQSEESLAQIVSTIYGKALSDRSFAATAARLCDKMALFMVEGTKFRSLLLNTLQKDFSRREELQASDVERWLGFITFLCEMFGTMRSSAGEPFRVLVCPIYTCLRELLESPEVKEDAVLCYSMELQSTGRLLEEQLPEMMTELLAAARDKMLCPAESQLTRSLLMEVIELHANHWTPLEALTTQYYNRTIQKLTTA